MFAQGGHGDKSSSDIITLALSDLQIRRLICREYYL